jgi:Uma2 family endonuclease
VATTSSTGLMTFAEFERLPESNAGRQELRHGELVCMSPPKWDHYMCQQRLRRLLAEAAGSRGVAGAEMAFRASPEHEFRYADVGYLSEERARAVGNKDNLRGAPDLVIEVLSPSNTVAEMIDKKTLCLENGSREFWVVDIDHAQVEVSTPDGRGITYKSGQQIPLFFAEGAQLAVDAISA